MLIISSFFYNKYVYSSNNSQPMLKKLIHRRYTHHRLRTVITKCSYIFLHTSISCSVFNPSLEQWAESWALMFQCMGFVLLRLWLDTLCVLGGFENVCQHLYWSISQVLQTIIMSRNTYRPGRYYQVLQGLEMRLNSLNNQPFLHLLYHDNM